MTTTCKRFLVYGVAIIVGIFMSLFCFAAQQSSAYAISANSVQMYRFYNPNSGEHFYTSSVAEKANLVQSGWNYEGFAWIAPTTGDPVYRVYSGTDHHYTMDAHEYNVLVNERGWKDEGIGWYSAPSTGLPLYRQFNPNVDPFAPFNNAGSHNYTLSFQEHRSLVQSGWRDEGIAWYALNEQNTDDVYLGSFFVDTSSNSGFQTVLCTSRDGLNFTQISVPFTDSQNPLHDPSIMYHNGYFWMLSNWNRQNGYFTPMISYSADLVTWSEPEGLGLINNGSYAGIALESLPFGIQNFDVVAPEWFVDDKNDVYIVFSAGYYGDFHGRAEHDRMKVYAVKVDLSAQGFSPFTSSNGKPFPNGLTLNAGAAFAINGLDASDNYIDSSVYQESGTYYLATKKDGVNNQIYANANMGANGWSRINSDNALGNEGPSITKSNDLYLMYTDKIATYHGNNGMQVCMSPSLSTKFSAPVNLGCNNLNGQSVKLRHGSVIKLDGQARSVCEIWMSANGVL